MLSWHIRVVPYVYHRAVMWLHPEQRDSAIWLPDYRADLNGMKIEGLTENVSGLTFNPETGTLFTVINRPPQVAELTTDGKLLRILPVNGARDPEGITHVEGDLYVIADEADQRLAWVHIDALTQEIALEGAPSLSLNLGALHNLGFEGVSWDSKNDDLLIVQEALPLRVMILSGLKEVIEGGPMKVDIRDWTASNASTLFMRDLSSLTLHEPTGHVLLLSHMSQMIVEYAADGRPVSMMTLPGVPQAEGIAVGAKGEIFVVSEPNLFYRFVRQTPPHWLASGR
ncbi:MAG: DNA-binding protein [Cereibacter sphaeroides]|uniref:DNA-binding protein n=1 Tax=Cereibacter sphaeroides TaxID=1063 RepID=A0A2W5UAM7_CERSP|nr:MAG: DNA-binding protein [Cereibacter sphaeroides]